MKKLLILSFLLITFSTQAQTTIESGGTACNEQNPSNNFEVASGISFWGAASDLTVPADTDFALTTINANLWVLGAGVTITSIDIVIYSDSGGLPDGNNLLAAYSGLVPVSQPLIGTGVGTNMDFDVLDVTFHIPTTALVGQTGATTTYWVHIIATASNADLVGWEGTTASIVGNPAFIFDFFIGWIPLPGRDFVYDFSGDCTPILGTSENTIKGFRFFPNPTSNVINLNSQDKIERVAIYNILGQKVVDQNINAISSQLNVANLVTGTYLMEVSVEDKTATYKIIKN